MDYNRNNVNLLNEQIDINSGLITELERLEAQSLASRMETSSLNKIINDLRATIGSVNHELQVTKQRLASAEREREQVTKELQDDRNGNASMVYEMDHSLVENKALKEELVHKTEEIDSMQSKLDECYVSIRRQKLDSEETIKGLAPELEVFKHLNAGLHVEISRLTKDLNSMQSEKQKLSEHIKDLTGAVEGFAVKFNGETDQRQKALKQLHQKNIELATLEEEHQHAINTINELKALTDQIEHSDYESERDLMASETKRLNEERISLYRECTYYKDECQRLNNLQAEQSQIRLQDREDFEALLAAGSESIQRAAEATRRSDDAHSDALVKEAQRVASDANKARNDLCDKYYESEKKITCLTVELDAERIKYDTACTVNRTTIEGLRIQLASYIEKLMLAETEYDNKISSLSVTTSEAVTQAQTRLMEKRDNTEFYIARLSDFQTLLSDIREDAWVLKSKIKQLELQLSLVKSNCTKNQRHISCSLLSLQGEHTQVFRCANDRLKYSEGRAKEEVERSMYLSSEVTNLKLELHECRKKGQKS